MANATNGLGAVVAVSAIGIGGGMIFRAWLQRRTARTTADQVSVLLPDRLKLWAYELSLAHLENGLDAYGVSVFDLAGILDKESSGGWTLAHIGARPSDNLGVDALKIWLANGTGDGGHGHGLMQIDIGSFGPWLAANNWRAGLTNIRKGASVLRDKIRFFRGSPTTSGIPIRRGGVTYRVGGQPRAAPERPVPDLRPLPIDQAKRAGIAAYNTGEGNVLLSLGLGLPPDTTTYGANYSADVLARAEQFEAGAVA